MSTPDAARPAPSAPLGSSVQSAPSAASGPPWPACASASVDLRGGGAPSASPVAASGPVPGPAADARPLVALRLVVNNHPGVMSHVCGLFARRAFNVEAILCTPVNGGEVSRIWLLVVDDERLEQMVRQVRKLHDVLDVRRQPAGGEAFARLADCMAAWERETAG